MGIFEGGGYYFFGRWLWSVLRGTKGYTSTCIGDVVVYLGYMDRAGWGISLYLGGLGRGLLGYLVH